LRRDGVVVAVAAKILRRLVYLAQIRPAHSKIETDRQRLANVIVTENSLVQCI